MARKPRVSSRLQDELLTVLMPWPRRAEQLSERIRPRLAEVGRAHAGQPAAEVRAVLEQVVRSAGAEPDLEALTEFAEQIEAGENPFE